MDLQEIRVEIDKTDKEIIALYEKRLALVNKVAEYKIANNKPVYDEKREQEKIASMRALTSDEMTADDIEAIYQLIFKLSRDRQNKIIGKKEQ